jgi:hypothetical protein
VIFTAMRSASSRVNKAADRRCAQQDMRPFLQRTRAAESGEQSPVSRGVYDTQCSRLRAQVHVNLRQQSRDVGSVPAIAITRIDGVEGDCAYQCSS